MARRVHGIEHPDTLGITKKLALVNQYQGRYDAAGKVLRQVLAAREKHLGVEHPVKLNTVNNLGRVYEAQNRFGDAEAMYKRAVASRGRLVDAEMLTSRTGSHSPL